MIRAGLGWLLDDGIEMADEALLTAKPAEVELDIGQLPINALCYGHAAMASLRVGLKGVGPSPEAKILVDGDLVSATVDADKSLIPYGENFVLAFRLRRSFGAKQEYVIAVKFANEESWRFVQCLFVTERPLDRADFVEAMRLISSGSS